MPSKRIDILGDIHNIGKHIPKGVKFQLAILDPPYGGIVKQKWDAVTDIVLATQLVKLCYSLERHCLPGAALYLYGGYGTPMNRAFYRFIIQLEQETNWKMACPITWNKTKGRGNKNNYVCTRQEIAYCILGEPNKPRVFNTTYLDELCVDGSKRKTRTMVWNDIPEILQGKTNECEKPPGLSKVIIEASSNPGDWILDGYAGTRNAARMAETLDRNVLSIENEKRTNNYQEEKYTKESNASHRRLAHKAALARVKRELAAIGI